LAALLQIQFARQILKDVHQLAQALSVFRVRYPISKTAAILDFTLNLYENFETKGPYTGGLSPGDDSHSATCEAVSSCRALRDKSSRSLPPCGRDLICSLMSSASFAKRCSNGALGWSGWMRGIMALLIRTTRTLAKAFNQAGASVAATSSR
jgi:hypothetical protein